MVVGMIMCGSGRGQNEDYRNDEMARKIEKSEEEARNENNFHSI